MPREASRAGAEAPTSEGQLLSQIKLINLSLNEYPEPPVDVLASLVPSILATANLYPNSELTALTHELAQFHQVAESEVLVTNGATEAIWLLARYARTAGPQEGEALIPACTFVAYQLACQAAGLPVHRAPMRPDLHFDFEALLHGVTPATSIVFLANPNNPTGAVCAPSELAHFLSWVPPSVVIVLDQAYRAFAEPEELPDIKLLRQQHPNLLVLHTFSKKYGIAGLRLGYMLGEPRLLAQLAQLRGPFSTNALALAAGRRLLSQPEVLRNNAASNHRRRQALAAALTRLGVGVYPSSANFLMVRFKDSADTIARALLHHRILVLSLADYGLRDCMRITVGSDEANARLVAALSQILHPQAVALRTVEMAAVP
jgi:histidinol-phosphate aminotransferase